nr:hypothetical protein [Escherichia coli]
MMSLWDALRMNMMISYQELVRTFLSTSKPGVYTFTFNALTYGGYEMTPVKVTINAVAAETENGEEEMP